MLRNKRKIEINQAELDRFYVDPGVAAGRVKRNEEIRARSQSPNTSSARQGSWQLYVIGGVAMAALCIGCLKPQAELHEVNFANSELLLELEELVADVDRLEIELQEKAPWDVVEAHARSLGMVPESECYVTRISVKSECSTVVFVEPEETLFDKLRAWAYNFLGGFGKN